MVTAEASTGMPARRLAMRATFMPCSPSGIAHPMITSSIDGGLELRHAIERALDRDGAELVGPHHAERALRRLADRGANGGNDDCVLHGSLSP